MGGADDCIGFVVLADDFCWAEGDEFEVAALIDDEVVGFQVADDDFLTHEVLEKQDERCCVELGICCAQQTDLSNRVIEILALGKFGDLHYEFAVFV